MLLRMVPTVDHPRHCHTADRNRAPSAGDPASAVRSALDPRSPAVETKVSVQVEEAEKEIFCAVPQQVQL